MFTVVAMISSISTSSTTVVSIVTHAIANIRHMMYNGHHDHGIDNVAMSAGHIQPFLQAPGGQIACIGITRPGLDVHNTAPFDC